MADELTKRGGQRRRDGDDVVEVGQWLWVKRGDDEEWLGCVVHVGTNYVKVCGPRDARSTVSIRILLTELWDVCRRELNARAVIDIKIAEQREVIAGAVHTLAELMTRLRLGESVPGSDTTALAAYAGASMGEYEAALVRAKKEDVPALKKKIEEAAEVMRGWMTADLLPFRAQERQADRSIKVIDERIAGVEVYSGLVEHLVQVRDGAPAAKDEPVFLFQRRHYMDEECLANYQAGGMSFEDLPAFEEWFVRPENFFRILPHERSVVAFRVRREKKESDCPLDSLVDLLFGGHDDKDMQTYLYLRNGDQAFRLETLLDFGEKLFPDVEHSVLRQGDEVYAKMFAGRVERLVTKGEYLDLQREEAERRKLYDEAPEGEKWQYFSRFGESDDYVPWNDGSVYFDDVTDYVCETMRKHNRLVLLLQGILDRSEALSPHPSCRLWQPEDFARLVRLVFDDSRALAAGDKPDFLAYQRECNRRLRRGAMTVGQEDFWLRREAERENENLRRTSGRDAHYLFKTKYRPDDDPGPGVVARVADYSASKSCSFTWFRPRRRRRYSWQDAGDEPKTVRDHMVVPVSELLCVEGYRPGDYHKFYDDPRTRADYLKWAPLLLRAEDWHAKRGK